MIGKIVSIKDNVVYVNLAINVYDMQNIIGMNVTFDDRFIGEIVSMSSNMLEVNLIGEIVNGKFTTGNLIMPRFGSVCRLSTKEEVDIIFGVTPGADIIKIGKSYVYKDYQICVNVGNFFANHFAILGNSGSGKSYFVSRLLQGIFYDARRAPINTNILLFDAFGEYQQAFSLINQVNSGLNYRVFTSDLKDESFEKILIPFWFLSLDDLCLLLNVDDSRQIPIIEKALKLVSYFCNKNSGDDISSQKNDIVARSILDVIFSGVNHSEVRNKIVTILTKFNTNEINLEINLTKGGWTRNIRQCITIDEQGKFADIEIVISYLEQFCQNSFELSMPDGTFMYTIKDLIMLIY